MTLISRGAHARRHALLLSTVLAGSACLALSAPASAQQTAAADVEEIVVTGTLIRGIAPVGSNVVGITREQIETSGATDSSQILATMPQSNLFLGLPRNSGQAAGVGRVAQDVPNLRNLPQGPIGNPTTLIVLDGRRIVPSGVETAAVDPGIIPPGILASVETILDGASALYGSDAAGGVINYITRRRFDETKVDAQYGFADNYWAVGANMTAGKTWEGGGLGVTYSFGKNSPLFNGDRDYAIARNMTLPGTPLTGTQCATHANVTAAGQTFTVNSSSITRGTTNCAANAFNSMYAAQERHAFFASLSQDLSDNVRFDMNAIYSSRDNFQYFGPFTTTVTIRNTHPYFRSLSAFGVPDTTSQSVSYNYGPLLGNTAQDGIWHANLWQVSPTITVDLGAWQARAYVSYGRSHTTTISRPLDSAMQATLLAGTTRASTINPYDVADPTSNIAGIRSLVWQSPTEGKFKFLQINATVDGPLFTLPGGEVKGAFGAEYTRTQFTSLRTSGTTRGRTAPIGATTAPKSLFAEFNAPIVGPGNAMPLIQALTLSVSGRWDDYQNFGKTFNPKFALTYDPVSWLTLRGNWGKSYRAPTATDKVGTANNAISCVGATLTEAGCLAIPGLYAILPPGSPAPTPGTVSVSVTGSQDNLKPERSKNYSIGADIRLPFVPGLTISPTYYHIDYRDAIAAPTGATAQGFVNLYNGAPHLFIIRPTAAQLAAFVAQGPSTGQNILNTINNNGYTVAYTIDGRTQNLTSQSVAGLDLNVRYVRPMSWGSLDANANGTWRLKSISQSFPGAPVNDGLDSGTSVFRASVQVGATYGDFRAQVGWQHLAGFNVTPTATRLASQTSIKAFNVFNTSFRYNLDGGTPLLQNVVLTLTVNNVLDTNPPLSYTTTGGTANGQTLGRFVQFGLSKKF